MKAATRPGLILFLSLLGFQILCAQPNLETDTAFVRSHRIRVARCYLGHFLFPGDSVPGLLQYTLTFDTDGRLESKFSPYPVGDLLTRYIRTGSGVLVKTETTYPKNVTHANDSVLYEYDSLGREIRQTEYESDWVKSSMKRFWNREGLEIRREYYYHDPVPQAVLVYEYSESDPITRTTYSLAGEKRVKDEVTKTDGDGRPLETEDWWRDSINFRTSYTYDDQQRLVVAVRHSDRNDKVFSLTENTWEGDQLVSQKLTGTGGKVVLWNQFEYYKNGLLQRVLPKQGEEDSVLAFLPKTRYSYDDAGRLTAQYLAVRDTNYIVKKWVYDEGGNLSSEAEYQPGTAPPLKTTLYLYEPGNKLPVTRKISYRKEPAGTNAYVPWQIRNKRPCPHADTITVRVKYKNNLPDAEYTDIRCEEDFNAFLLYGPEMGMDLDYYPPRWGLEPLEPIRKSGTGPIFTSEFMVGVPGKYPHYDACIRLHRTIHTLGDTVIYIKDTGPDGRVWLECSRQHGIIEGEYLSKLFVCTSNSRIAWRPYERDTLIFNSYDEEGNLRVSDTTSGDVKEHVPVTPVHFQNEYEGGLLRKSILRQNDGYHPNAIVYYYNDQKQMVEERGYNGPDMVNATFYKWENGHIVEECSRHLYGATFTRWEYGFFKD